MPTKKQAKKSQNDSLEWHTEKRKVKDLIPYENNPRRMSSFQMKKLKESIEKFNFVEIPAINLDGRIIAGHQRLKALSSLGMDDEEVERLSLSGGIPDQVEGDFDKGFIPDNN